MAAKLIAIAGPLEGSAFVLSGGEVIGRDASNPICVEGPLVSRRHCAIERDGDGFKVVDLESSNGVFVNGVPVSERRLEHGNKLLVGSSLFVFHSPPAASGPVAPPVGLSDGAVPTHSTIRLRRDEALYLDPERLLAGPAPSPRVARDLAALLKIGTAVGAIRDLNELQRRLLDLLLDAIPAERGAVLLADADGETISSVYGRERREDEARPFAVSGTLVRQVLREGSGLLAEAPAAASVLAVPLTLFGRTLGAIYLDTADPAVRFGAEDLELLTAAAAMATAAIENARHVERLENEARRLRAHADIEHSMIGESPRMRALYDVIARVAPTDATVLVTGESGTGKELAAHAIHRNSRRADGPFVAVNCAALAETLLESEMFGHEKGAFTGAVARKQGKLEAADGGTVFLDEVGEMAPALQAKLLRVLQERTFERVGGTRPVAVDVRVVAATNRDLGEAIRTGAFRQDLFYRLNVVTITMPPLRERREDVESLAAYFAARYAERCKRRVTGISADALRCLEQYDWPGNVRELENAIERAVVLGSSELIHVDDLPEALLEAAKSAGPAAGGFYDAVNDAKRRIVARALEEAGGSYTAAAKALGLHPNNLHRLVRNLGLREKGRG